MVGRRQAAFERWLVFVLPLLILFTPAVSAWNAGSLSGAAPGAWCTASASIVAVCSAYFWVVAATTVTDGVANSLAAVYSGASAVFSAAALAGLGQGPADGSWLAYAWPLFMFLLGTGLLLTAYRVVGDRGA